MISLLWCTWYLCSSSTALTVVTVSLPSLGLGLVAFIVTVSQSTMDCLFSSNVHDSGFFFFFVGKDLKKGCKLCTTGSQFAHILENKVGVLTFKKDLASVRSIDFVFSSLLFAFFHHPTRHRGLCPSSG